MKSFKKKKVAAEPIVEEVKEEEIKEEAIEEVAEEAEENANIEAEAEAEKVEDIIDEPAEEEKPKRKGKKAEKEEPVEEKEELIPGDLVTLKEPVDYIGREVEAGKVYRIKDIVGDNARLKLGGIIAVTAKVDNLVKESK